MIGGSCHFNGGRNYLGSMLLSTHDNRVLSITQLLSLAWIICHFRQIRKNANTADSEQRHTIIGAIDIHTSQNTSTKNRVEDKHTKLRGTLSKRTTDIKKARPNEMTRER